MKSNSNGKMIAFNDGNIVDIKQVANTDSNYQLKVIDLKDINLLEDYLVADDEETGDIVNLTNISLKKSLALYGQMMPLVVGLDMTRPDDTFYLLDGYKRYKYLKEDDVEEARCLVINLADKNIGSVIRLLTNQKVKPSVNQLLAENEAITSRTNSIKSNLIEPALQVAVTDLDVLSKAKVSQDIQTERVYKRFTEEKTDINSLRRIVEREEKGETKPVLYEKRETPVATPTVAKGNSESSSAFSDGLKDERNANVVSSSTPKGKGPQSSGKTIEFEGKLSSNVDGNRVTEGTDREGYMGGLDEEGTQILSRIGGDANAKNVHPAIAGMTKEELAQKRIAEKRQSVNDRKILPREIREQVLSRDERKCQVCGIGETKTPSVVSTFELHHMRDVQYGGGDSVDNLITLCPLCHKLITTYGKQKSNVLHGLKPYSPSNSELDDNPLFWSIVVLGAIESYSYKDALQQIKDKKRNLYNRIQKRTMTIGQALAEFPYEIETKFSPYEVLNYGKLHLLENKSELGFRLFNEQLADEYESYGNSIAKVKKDDLHQLVDRVIGYERTEQD